MRKTIWLCALALAAGAGCEQSEDSPLRIGGDSIMAVQAIEIDGVAQAAECRGTLGAYLDEPELEATITGGLVVYTQHDTLEVARVRWDESDVKSFWPQNTITSERAQASMPLSISTSLPFSPMRGEATFEYVLAGDKEPRTTRPFIFHCR